MLWPSTVATTNDATRDEVAALERDAEAVLLMAAELVARARAGVGSAEANAAMLRARAALSKPFVEEGRRQEQRQLLEVVDAIADAYRRLPTTAKAETIESTLVGALRALGFHPAASCLTTLAAEHKNVKSRGGPVEAAKAVVAQVGAALLVERRRRLGLGGGPALQSQRGVGTLGSVKRDLSRAPEAEALASSTADSALELLLPPHAAGAFDDALAELHSPTDLEAERRWAAMQEWDGQT